MSDAVLLQDYPGVRMLLLGACEQEPLHRYRLLRRDYTLADEAQRDDAFAEMWHWCRDQFGPAVHPVHPVDLIENAPAWGTDFHDFLFNDGGWATAFKIRWWP